RWDAGDVTPVEGCGQNLCGVAEIYRARSAARAEEAFGCRIVFTLGFATCSRRRTPRPPVALAAPGLINSIPAFSSAEISFISEPTLARITPSLASMR